MPIMKKTFLLISPKNRTVYNFRGDLVREFQARGYEVYVTGPNRVDIDRVEALGVHFVELPMNKNGINPTADLRYLWRLWRLMRRVRPDVVLGYTIKPVIYGSVAARLAGVPSVNAMVTGVGYLFTSTSAKARALKAVAQGLYRLAFACARNVIFQNPDDRREFVEHGLVSERKTHVVNGSGVNMERFAPSSLPERFTVLCISRALKSKGVQEYLEAARLVKTERPDVRFLYLGAVDEHMADAVERRVVESCVADGIVEQFPETPDIRPVMAQCSVFVLPSYREGTPRTVLEAMASGRPVVTTDVPGCRETVVQGRGGYLVPVRDAGALAEQILRMAAQPREQLEQMGREARTLCREKFEVSRVNAQMLSVMLGEGNS